MNCVIRTKRDQNSIECSLSPEEVREERKEEKKKGRGREGKGREGKGKGSQTIQRGKHIEIIERRNAYAAYTYAFPEQEIAT